MNSERFNKCNTELTPLSDTKLSLDDQMMALYFGGSGSIPHDFTGVLFWKRKACFLLVLQY
jgi:hypothetical protein